MNGQINFGSGRLFLHDGTNAVEVGVLKDVSVDFASTQKELRGNRTYAIAIATSGQKISGKASSGVFSASWRISARPSSGFPWLARMEARRI